MSGRLELCLLSYSEMETVEILFLNKSESLLKISLGKGGSLHSDRHAYTFDLFSFTSLSELIVTLIYKPN